MATENKPTADWMVIEAEFRAGIKPLRLIAEEHGITHGAINKRAKRDEWVRDLAAKIRAQADAKVSKAAVSKEVSKQKLVTEKQVIDANVDLQFEVRMSHRKDMARNRALASSLMDELEAETNNKGLFDQLGELLAEPDDNGNLDKLNQLYRKAISLPGRVDSAKKLTEIMEKNVKMEREAFGIDAEKQDNPVDAALKALVAFRANRA